MGSRILTQLQAIWREASPRHRVLAGVVGMGALAAVVGLTVAHLQRAPPAGLAVPAARAASNIPSTPHTESPAQSRSTSSLFAPYSSLQSAATRDVEQRVGEAISSFRDVARARVLVRPAVESPFGESSDPASVLVILGVREGGRLGADVIEAIAECATASGAPLPHVRVMSESGQALFRGGSVLVTQATGATERPQASAAPPRGKARPGQAEDLLVLMGITAGGALVVGFVGALALSGRRSAQAEDRGPTEADDAPAGGVALAVPSSRSPLAGLTADELLALVADERPAVAARVLEGADAEAAAAVLRSLPEAGRADIAAIGNSAMRPWRRARAALYRAAAAKHAALPPTRRQSRDIGVARGGGLDGARD